MAANPQASTNAACEGWSDTLAAYRFLNNNSSITPDQILQPHVAATERRIHEHPVVLIVQDTTELDCTSHPPNLTHLNRECPSLPCDAVYEDCEWMSVWKVVTKEEIPDTPPLSEFMPLLTRLGGYNNRPSEPPPGPQTVWVGIRRMCDFATAWIEFGPKRETCV